MVEMSFWCHFLDPNLADLARKKAGVFFGISFKIVSRVILSLHSTPCWSCWTLWTLSASWKLSIDACPHLDYHPPPGTNTYGPFQKMTPLCYNVICGHNMGVHACMMMGFHSRLLAGSYWGIEHLAELKIAKISSFFQGSGAGSVRSRSPYYWSRLRNFCWLGQSVNCGRILMIFTVLESSWKSRWRMSRFQSSGNQFEQR